MKISNFGDLISYKEDDLNGMSHENLVAIILQLIANGKERISSTSVVFFHELFEALGPFHCPECGAELEVKSTRKDGRLFLGCTRWNTSRCKGSLNLMKYTTEKFLKTHNAYRSRGYDGNV